MPTRVNDAPGAEPFLPIGDPELTDQASPAGVAELPPEADGSDEEQAPQPAPARTAEASFAALFRRQILEVRLSSPTTAPASSPPLAALGNPVPATPAPAAPAAATAARFVPPGPLSAGDKLELMVWDRQAAHVLGRTALTIDANGDVTLPYTGAKLHVGGLTADEAQVAAQEALSRQFRAPSHVWLGVTQYGGAPFDPGVPTYPGETRLEAARRAKLDEFKVNERVVPEDLRDDYRRWVDINQHRTAFLDADPVTVMGELAATRYAPKTPRPIDDHLEFIDQKQREIAGLEGEEKRTARAALDRYMAWLDSHVDDDAALEATSPYEVYGRSHRALQVSSIYRRSEALVAREAELRATDPERWAKVEAKLDEYWQVAYEIWAEAHRPPRSNGPWLVIESETRRDALVAYGNAVLDTAYANAGRDDFLDSDPRQVARNVAANYPGMKEILAIAQDAPPSYEYLPVEQARQSLGEMAFETLVGLIPVAGDMADAYQATTGRSLTGYPLSGGDRVLAGVAVLVPFVSSSTFRTAEEAEAFAVRAASVTGRNADEFRALVRLGQRISPEDQAILMRAFEDIQARRAITPAMRRDLEGVYGRLRGPLEQVKAPQLARVRNDPYTGQPLVAGTPQHMTQRWFEYQHLHSDKYPRFTSEIDPRWKKQYETILANRPAGGAFEDAALKSRGLEKNNELFMDPSGKGGFIPDAIVGHSGPIEWGQPYHFVEVKGWGKLSDTGNLAKMLTYVENYGGHIDIVIRSDTRLSGRLAQRIEELRQEGKATVTREP